MLNVTYGGFPMDALDVIEWQDVTGTEIVHRWPPHGAGNIRLGSQLTVRESQAAVFFRDGQALDTFHAGRHTLETLNLPLVQKLINIPFGGETPFQAEVYFVNLRTMTDLKWGTRSPILFRDKELAMVQLRAYGMFTCRVAEPQLFVNKVVGTEGRYDLDSVEAWMRSFIVSRFNDTLGEVLETILDLGRVYDEIGIACRERCREDFDKFGIELLDLLVEAITPPEEVQKMINE
ncbi:MAG: SPFH domain-containing protein, partial [Armatimonadetes bacterium]|nr:SPFH domain-containing protein [Armatimonadota bacterium]